MLAGAELEGIEAFEVARVWFRNAGDVTRAAHAGHRLGQAYWRLERIPDARVAMESALMDLQDAHGAELVQILVDLATLLAINMNEQSQSILYARRGCELAIRLEDRGIQASASRTLGNLLVRTNQLAEGIELLEHALELAAGADVPVEAAECCACLFGAYMWQGSLVRARATAVTWLDFAQRCHDPYQMRHVYIWIAFCHLFSGEQSEADRWLEHARETVERLASPQPLAWLTYCRGGVAYMRGQYEDAEGLIQQGLAVFRETSPDGLVWYVGFLCLVQAALRKVEEARVCIEELELRVASLPEGMLPAGSSLAYLTESALMLDDRKRLERYYPKLLPFSGQFHDMLIDRLLGQIDTARRDWTEAGTHLAAAEAMARRESMVPELARTLEARAELALALGRDTKIDLRPWKHCVRQWTRTSVLGMTLEPPRRTEVPHGAERADFPPAPSGWPQRPRGRGVAIGRGRQDKSPNRRDSGPEREDGHQSPHLDFRQDADR